MQAPQIPVDEPDRLATLHSLNLLDTPPEARFDRYTRLSARVFDVPIALITLVDRYRQWFKSRHGLDVSETPREHSFCGHAILGDELFEIRNARRDPRFRDNPLVVGKPHIRFYAGAPLICPNGQRLGTLCIIDRVHRHLYPDEREVLTDLADIIVGEITGYIDTETGLTNRNGLRSLGAKVVSAGWMNGPPRLLLFDISHHKHNMAARQQNQSGLQLFAQMLQQRFPSAEIIAHIGSGNFCVMLKDNEGLDEQSAVRQLCTEATKLLQYDVAADVLPVFVGRVVYDPDKHASIDEIIREADSLFYQRAQQRLYNLSAPA
ncbi:MAG: GAF domain-containing protein [Gammaproteobacteria bacterium]|nr:GAF domain-containing protein [Gammaproteobacteria bacterium]